MDFSIGSFSIAKVIFFYKKSALFHGTTIRKMERREARGIQVPCSSPLRSGEASEPRCRRCQLARSGPALQPTPAPIWRGEQVTQGYEG